MAPIGVIRRERRHSGSAMNSEDLRRRNARLHDLIEQVLEMHPDLRDGTEAMALNQDLHVEVGAPFLERTRDKLLERARAIVERCPELVYYFDDPLKDAASRDGPSDITLTTAALAAHVALRIRAERLLAAYVTPESNRADIIHELITLFDGPQQREAQRLAAEALGETGENVSEDAKARLRSPTPDPPDQPGPLAGDSFSEFRR
jgi:hypothetical protein